MEEVIKSTMCPILYKKTDVPLEVLVKFKDGKPIGIICNEYKPIKNNKSQKGCYCISEHKSGKEIFGECFYKKGFSKF